MWRFVLDTELRDAFPPERTAMERCQNKPPRLLIACASLTLAIALAAPPAPSAAETSARGIDPGNLLAKCDLLVITTKALRPAWTPFVEHKRRFGLPACLATVQKIESSATGRDLPERIRNYIRKVHQTQGTRWFLLAGDSDTLPPRMVACDAYNAAERAVLKGPVATDLYFADLDGTWDENHNGVFGELADGCDLKPDVYVGRVPVRTAEEVALWLEKLQAYEGAIETDYQDRVLLLGEKVGSFLGQTICSSLAFENSIVPKLPASVRITRLYDAGCPKAEAVTRSAKAQFDAIESGHGLTLNYGHGMWDWLGALHLTDLPLFTNSRRPGIYMTTECNGCEFTHPRVAHVACEAFVLGKGGGVAYLGNTEFGVGMPWLMFFYNSLVQRLYSTPAITLGQLVADTLAEYSQPEELAKPNSDQRWQQFVTVLMGDPSMVVKTATPRLLLLEERGEQGAASGTIHYRVTSAGQPVEGARITLYRPGSFLYVLYTQSDGEAQFSWQGEAPASPYSVTVGGPDLVSTGLSK